MNERFRIYAAVGLGGVLVLVAIVGRFFGNRGRGVTAGI